MVKSSECGFHPGHGTCVLGQDAYLLFVTRVHAREEVDIVFKLKKTMVAQGLKGRYAFGNYSKQNINLKTDFVTSIGELLKE